MSALTNSVRWVFDTPKRVRVPDPTLGIDPTAIANCLHSFRWEAMTPQLKIRVEEALRPFGLSGAEVSFERDTLVVTLPDGEVLTIEQALRAR